MLRVAAPCEIEPKNLGVGERPELERPRRQNARDYPLRQRDLRTVQNDGTTELAKKFQALLYEAVRAGIICC
jgi:hypothetical protein